MTVRHSTLALIIPLLASMAAAPASQPASHPTSNPFDQFLEPQPTTMPADPLGTPTDAVKDMFELFAKADAEGVRDIMIDPPELSRVRQEVEALAPKFGKGVSWSIVDNYTKRSAAVVICSVRPPGGEQGYFRVLLLNRYDRWKVALMTVNPRRMSREQTEDFNDVSNWAKNRIAELKGTTKPATQAAATQPAAP